MGGGATLGDNGIEPAQSKEGVAGKRGVGGAIDRQCVLKLASISQQIAKLRSGPKPGNCGG